MSRSRLETWLQQCWADADGFAALGHSVGRRTEQTSWPVLFGWESDLDLIPTTFPEAQAKREADVKAIASKQKAKAESPWNVGVDGWRYVGIGAMAKLSKTRRFKSR